MENPTDVKPPYKALGVAVVIFFINMSSISTSSSNGVLTSCSYTDFFALIAGAILLLYGVTKAIVSKGNITAILVSLAVAGLGALHVARGLGLVMSPCS